MGMCRLAGRAASRHSLGPGLPVSVQLLTAGGGVGGRDTIVSAPRRRWRVGVCVSGRSPDVTLWVPAGRGLPRVGPGVLRPSLSPGLWAGSGCVARLGSPTSLWSRRHDRVAFSFAALRSEIEDPDRRL